MITNVTITTSGDSLSMLRETNVALTQSTDIDHDTVVAKYILMDGLYR